MSDQARVPQLVLLHGFTGGPESWSAVRSHLTEPWASARTLTPQIAGHGEHPESAGVGLLHHSFEAEVDRLAVTCHAHGDRATASVLVGYSLGARLGLGLIVKYPRLFQRAVLVGVNPGLETPEERRTRGEQDEQWARFAEHAGLEIFLNRWQSLPLFGTQANLPQGVRDEQARIRRRNTAAGLAHSLRTCGLCQMPNYMPDLQQVQVPVALVAGQRDDRFVELARRMSAVLPRASLHLVPECGHNVPLEAPAALAALIQAHP